MTYIIVPPLCGVLVPCTSRIFASLDVIQGIKFLRVKLHREKMEELWLCCATSVSFIQGENLGERLFPSLLILRGKLVQEHKDVCSLPALQTERDKRQAAV